MKVFIFLIYAFKVNVALSSELPKNNVCPTNFDYSSKLINKKCWYNSDVDLSVPEIIKKYGYPFEEYEIITDDGYKLPLYRIPYGKNSIQNPSEISQPVFLLHGLFCSSAPFVINGNKSIAFIHADKGYDVWLANSRGSTYGKAHVNLSIQDPRFWNFSFHEVALYDIPKSLDFIYNETGRNDIIFLGFSLGTNIQSIYASLLPEHAEQRVKYMVYLAPTLYLFDLKSVPFIFLFSMWPVLNEASKAFGIGEIMSKSQIPTPFTTLLCAQSGILASVCELSVMTAFGFDLNINSPELFPVFLAHFPGGSSVKTVVHLGQNYESRRFCRFDYGPERNKEIYNLSKPPDYDMTKIMIPGLIMYGANDYISTKEGAIELFKRLPKGGTTLYEIKYKQFTHINYMLGRNIDTEVANPMLSYMNMYKMTKSLQ